MPEAVPVFFSKRTALAIAIGWTCLLVVLLSLPGSSLPDTTLWKYDKIGHAGIFLVLSLVWMNVLSPYGMRVIMLVVVCGLLLAPLSEWYQSALPFGRTADLFDSVADGIGFAVGTIAWMVFFSWKKRRE